MRTRRTLTLMTFMTAFLMLMTSVAQAGGPKAEPVRESLEGNFAGIAIPAPTGRCSAPAALLSYAGTGYLGGVGDVTFTSAHCSYVLPEGEPGRYGEAVLTMVTADGDEIHATYKGRQLDETRYFEVLRIVGGTGDFEDASGVIFEIVTVDLTTYNVSIRGWGWIVKYGSQAPEPME